MVLSVAHPDARSSSLVPHATELLFALGLGDEVVAVTHECDHPPRPRDAARRSRATCCRRASPPARSTRAVRERTEARRGDLRARRGAAARARARPDRHPGAVRGLRGLLRRRARGGAERLDRARRSSRSTRTTLGEMLGDVRTLAQATGARDAGARPRRPPARRAIDRVRLAVAGAAAGARRRARVARPGLRRRPLDAAADRATPAAWTCSASPASTPSRRTWEARRGRAARGRRRDAVRLRRRARARGGRRRTPAQLRRARRRARRRGRRRPPTSRAPARGWSTASSCSPTCCTPTGVAAPRGRRAARSTCALRRRRRRRRATAGPARRPTSAPATATAASATHPA